ECGPAPLFLNWTEHHRFRSISEKIPPPRPEGGFKVLRCGFIKRSCQSLHGSIAFCGAIVPAGAHVRTTLLIASATASPATLPIIWAVGICGVVFTPGG